MHIYKWETCQIRVLPQNILVYTNRTIKYIIIIIEMYIYMCVCVHMYVQLILSASGMERPSLRSTSYGG